MINNNLQLQTNIKTFYRFKLVELNDKTMYASIDCLNSTVRYVVSSNKDINNEVCYTDFLDAITNLNDK